MGGGARYGGVGMEITISPAIGEAADLDGSDRSNQPAQIRVVKGKSRGSMTARWSCGNPNGA